MIMPYIPRLSNGTEDVQTALPQSMDGGGGWNTFSIKKVARAGEPERHDRSLQKDASEGESGLLQQDQLHVLLLKK